MAKQVLFCKHTHEGKIHEKNEISLKYNNNNISPPPRLKINENKEVSTACLCVFFSSSSITCLSVSFCIFSKNNIDADGCLQVVLYLHTTMYPNREKKYASCLEFANENEN